MKTISYSTLVVTLLTLLGCGSLVQEVDPGNLPTATPKMVVHCFISPQDTLLAVYVQAPRAVLGTKFTDNGGFYLTYSLQGSVVTLSDGTRTVQLPGVGGTIPLYYGIDTRQFPIVAGRTYTLTVSNAYFPTVTAQCTVPKAVKPTEIRADSLSGRANGLPGTTYYGRLVWQDAAGEANYYQVSGNLIKTVTRPIYTTPNVPTRDTTLTNMYPLSFNGVNLITDQNVDGQRLISARGEAREFNYNSLERTIGLVFTMTLSNIDENYYRYRETVDRQGDADENPFAEPVLVPSNIQGGYGCFGAYNQSTLTVKVK
ncbi:DUF4249 domain-containing protein [Fibrella forsythiae]|uniref:DUF4249 domain-containing protein n=1 Tax=Fibrella forsythiae TaxID=2817061 RepID=A0ABS3JTL7_9BACT|nr:DUF4249 domain-containing protein [Fibrella forsythiae]MBO0952726.1 DUF4249 domain-containing protein [Fibrella forsythiae]